MSEELVSTTHELKLNNYGYPCGIHKCFNEEIAFKDPVYIIADIMGMKKEDPDSGFIQIEPQY